MQSSQPLSFPRHGVANLPLSVAVLLRADLHTTHIQSITFSAHGVYHTPILPSTISPFLPHIQIHTYQLQTPLHGPVPLLSLAGHAPTAHCFSVLNASPSRSCTAAPCTVSTCTPPEPNFVYSLAAHSRLRSVRGCSTPFPCRCVRRPAAQPPSRSVRHLPARTVLGLVAHPPRPFRPRPFPLRSARDPATHLPVD